MSSKIDLPHAFLKRFVKKIVLNALPPDVLLEEYIESEAAQNHILKIKDEAQKIKLAVSKINLVPTTATQVEEIHPKKQEFPIQKTNPKIPEPRPFAPPKDISKKIPQKAPEQFHPTPPKNIVENTPEPETLQSTEESEKITVGEEKIEGPTFGRISPYVNNPRVKSIEIPGPNKPVLIKQEGLTNTSSIVLDSTEIESILEKVSDITRIPLIEGPFKAIIENLLITAVYSKSLGSRLIVQKIAPYVPHQ